MLFFIKRQDEDIVNKTLLQIKISSTCNTYVLLESISACIRCINIWVQVLSENLCDFSTRIFTWVQILQENLYYNTWVQVLQGMNGIGKKPLWSDIFCYYNSNSVNSPNPYDRLAVVCFAPFFAASSPIKCLYLSL